MKVKKIDVYWCNEFSNVPNLELYVDKKPDYNQIMRFECKKYHDNDIYYAYDEDSGLVKFYYHGHKNHNGGNCSSIKSQPMHPIGCFFIANKLRSTTHGEHPCSRVKSLCF